jgi:aspartate racemase
MKTIGLLGGMSWESTVSYYQTVNRIVGSRLGGLHSAKVFLHSVDFHEIETFQRDGSWDRAGEILADGARAVERGGVDFLVLCTNTMHRVAPAIERAISVPLLHIADATADAIRAAGLDSVGLLGTRFTMEQDFYRGRLEARHGLKVLVPDEPDRQLVHRVIYDELCLGQTLDASRDEYRRIVSKLADAGAQGVILGCTEIGLLLAEADCPVPSFDTARIHAERAAELALG